MNTHIGEVSSSKLSEYARTFLQKEMIYAFHYTNNLTSEEKEKIRLCVADMLENGKYDFSRDGCRTGYTWILDKITKKINDQLKAGQSIDSRTSVKNMAGELLHFFYVPTQKTSDIKITLSRWNKEFSIELPRNVRMGDVDKAFRELKEEIKKMRNK